MAALQCEICGGKLIGRPGGIFECDSCGMEYDTAWAKAKTQEIKGTVQVEGVVEVKGTVKVEGTTSKENLLKRGNMALENRDFEKANDFFEQVLNIDADCAEAYLGKALSEMRVCDVEQLKALEYFPEKNDNYIYAIKCAEAALAERLQRTLDENKLNRFAKELQDQRECENSAKKLPAIRKRIEPAQKMIKASFGIVVGLKADGTVFSTGKIDQLSDWWNISQISVGDFMVAGLKADGTVVTSKDYNVSGWKDIVAIATGDFHCVGLKSDGTVLAAGDNDFDQCNVSDWRNISGVCAGKNWTCGIREDGTVLFAGTLGYSDLGKVDNFTDVVAVRSDASYVYALRSDGMVRASIDYKSKAVSEWRDIIEICCNGCNIVGLKSNGTVVAMGDNDSGECEVSEWRDIVSICCGTYHTVGLKSDGTVVVAGRNKCGEGNVSGWSNIVAIAATSDCTVGLREDGTVLITGKSEFHSYSAKNWKLFNSLDTLDQEISESYRSREEKWNIQAAKKEKAQQIKLAADMAKRRAERERNIKPLIAAGAAHAIAVKANGAVLATGNNGHGQCNVSQWRNVVAVAAGWAHSVGLKDDGTVIAVGRNSEGQCNVNHWRNVCSVSAGDSHTVGLTTSGTVVAVGNNRDGQCNVDGWRDIVAISAGLTHTVGLKSDGTIVAVGKNDCKQCDVGSLKEIKAIAADTCSTIAVTYDGEAITETGCALRVSVNSRRGKEGDDIVSVAARSGCAVGLRADGTVIEYGVSFRYKNIADWKDIVSVAVGNEFVIGLSSNGRVLATGKNVWGECDTQEWKLFESFESLQQERKEAQAKRRAGRKAELEITKCALNSELVDLKGLFSGKRRKEIETRLAEIEVELKGL